MQESIAPRFFWFYVLLTLWCVCVYFAARFAMNRWDAATLFRRAASLMSWLPLGALFLCMSLFIRIRLSAGEWAYRDLSGFASNDYRPQRHAEGFELHFNLAQLSLLLALCSIAICGPFLLSYVRSRSHAIRPAAIYAVSWTALVILRWLDPGEQLAWLVPK